MANLALVVAIGGAFSDPTRLRVYVLSDGSLSVRDVAERIGVTPSDVSYHSGVLERAGLLVVVRRGRRHLLRRRPEGLRVLEELAR
jgi:DNA-binding transcriptional ArsR family regulator